MIEGVHKKTLRSIPDERGRVWEILRCDDELFKRFGQAYITTTYPGVIKAWHMHRKQTDNICCVQGMIKLVLYDSRKDSPTYQEINQFYLGIHNPMLIQIPADIYHGWMCISLEESMVINIPTEPYDREDPDEHRLPPHDNDIPYEWSRKDG